MKPLKVLGFLDSPFMRADMTNIDGSENEYVTRVKAANANGILTPTELNSRCKSEKETYQCFIADYLLAYIETPAVIVSD